MKICAWREADSEDVKALGITKEDLAIINANLAYVARKDPDRAHKAQLVLSELGVQKLPSPKPEEVSSLAELIQFYRQHENKEASIEEIRKWQNEIEGGVKPSLLAKSISQVKDMEAPSNEMDI